MTDFAQARRTMVDCQVRTNDVTEGRVVDAFLAVPREAFVPAPKQALAYLDADLAVGPAGSQRYLIQPMFLAKLVQLAGVKPTDVVLDVGAATGYSAAILSQLAAKVVALESDESLAGEAKTALASYDNVSVTAGPLANGAAASGPYDVILLQGSVEEVPLALFESLREGGRLIAVVGRGRAGRATIFVRVGGDFTGRIAFDASLSALPGFAKAPAFTF
ncbi:protein-L-isoaspartate O-methyltransferase family protein [Labrys okinawensis]|uniref:protein-L-isoaspartate O-methyltransferase family protein n=1 Tax=Labrys okinawensis TaxID=346911 RepID=UPI0039BCD58E